HRPGDRTRPGTRARPRRPALPADNRPHQAVDRRDRPADPPGTTTHRRDTHPDPAHLRPTLVGPPPTPPSHRPLAPLQHPPSHRDHLTHPEPKGGDAM